MALVRGDAAKPTAPPTAAPTVRTAVPTARRVVPMTRWAVEVISPACMDCMAAVSERMPDRSDPAFFATA